MSVAQAVNGERGGACARMQTPVDTCGRTRVRTCGHNILSGHDRLHVARAQRDGCGGGGQRGTQRGDCAAQRVSRGAAEAQQGGVVALCGGKHLLDLPQHDVVICRHGRVHGRLQRPYVPSTPC